VGIHYSIPTFSDLLLGIFDLTEVLLKDAFAFALIGRLDEKQFKRLAGKLLIGGIGRIEKSVSQKIPRDVFFGITLFPSGGNADKMAGRLPFSPRLSATLFATACNISLSSAPVSKLLIFT